MLDWLVKKITFNVFKDINIIGDGTYVYGIKSVVFYHDYIAKHADKYLVDRDKDYIKTIINCMISSFEMECIRKYENDVDKLQEVSRRIISYLGDKIDHRFSQNKYYLNFNRVYFLISKVYTEVTNDLGLGVSIGKGEKR